MANSSHQVAAHLKDRETKTAVGMVHGEHVTLEIKIKLGSVHRLSAFSALLSETPLTFRSVKQTPVFPGSVRAFTLPRPRQSRTVTLPMVVSPLLRQCY